MNDADLMEKIIDREPIYDGKIVHLERLTVSLPDGRTATREAIRHVGAVAVVAADEKGRISLVKQCRIAIGRVLTEIPAGKLDSKGEDWFEAARRELREETGLSAGQIELMTDIVTTPGFCDEHIALFLATDLTQGDTDFDDDEFLNVLRVPAPEVYRMIYAGELTDGKSVAALLFARPLLEKRGIKT